MNGQKNGRHDSRPISVILSTNSRRCVISTNGIWQLVWKWWTWTMLETPWLTSRGPCRRMSSSVRSSTTSLRSTASTRAMSGASWPIVVPMATIMASTLAPTICGLHLQRCYRRHGNPQCCARPPYWDSRRLSPCRCSPLWRLPPFHRAQPDGELHVTVYWEPARLLEERAAAVKGQIPDELASIMYDRIREDSHLTISVPARGPHILFFLLLNLPLHCLYFTSTIWLIPIDNYSATEKPFLGLRLKGHQS